MPAKTQAKSNASSKAKPKMKTVSKPVHAERFPGESKAYRAARDRLTRAEMELRGHVEQVAALRRRGQDPRHVDPIWPLWNLFDLTPKGRGADWYPKLAYAV